METGRPDIDRAAPDQRQAIEWYENAGWTFLHWAEVPELIAVLQGPRGEALFIDKDGLAWEGPDPSWYR